MERIQQFMKNSPLYVPNIKMDVKGLVLHSVGCAQPNPRVFANSWNSPNWKNASIHGFIGEDLFIETVPMMESPGRTQKAFHVGAGSKGSYNDSHIGIEMCEPGNITYTGGANFTSSNIAESRAFVEKTTQNAVELFAELCQFHNLDPLADGVIVSHKEARQRGYGSNHGDPDHLWPQVGMDYNMDKFRQDVAEELARITKKEEPKEEPKKEVAKKESNELKEFKKLFNEMRNTFRDNDAGNWSKEAREWAVKTGLVAGMSDGKFNGAWEDFLTREQMVVLLHRFYKMLEKK